MLMTLSYIELDSTSNFVAPPGSILPVSDPTRIGTSRSRALLLVQDIPLSELRYCFTVQREFQHMGRRSFKRGDRGYLYPSHLALLGLRLAIGAPLRGASRITLGLYWPLA